ncbi:MAG: O-acetyl-ADP-ribose deacetylase [Planctomycetia bacterium]|nr:O-acetyl-ADP-ribose deacetylase [Planctomycetia bacterium]
MKILLEMGDITRKHVDVIVNAANKTLLGGGGVDGAIHRAAGPALLACCSALGGCETGEAKLTPGFNLPASYVIHTPGPVYSAAQHAQSVKLLENCYWNSLSLADQAKCRTIAFPSISTGAYHFPVVDAARIALRTLVRFGKERAINLQAATMVLFDPETYRAYQFAMKELWDELK